MTYLPESSWHLSILREMSQEAFKRLAKLVVRSFYGGKCPPAGYRDDEENESARNKLKLVRSSHQIADKKFQLMEAEKYKDV
jgi:hypothetical protein